MSSDKPFGNLSFREYTFSTDTEKLCIALEAALRVKGYPQKNSALSTLLRLKKLLGKDKRYTFTPVSVSSVPVSTAAAPVSLPVDQYSDSVAAACAHALGIPLKQKRIQQTTQHFIVTLLFGGPLSPIVATKGFERILSSGIQKACPSVSSVVVDPAKVAIHEKTKNCAVKLRVIYRVKG